MVTSEKLQKKGEIFLEKAEIMMDNEEHKKSAEFFQKAAKVYQELEEWKIAEKSLLYASKNFHTLGGERNFHRAALIEREAANCSILSDDFIKARDFFDVSAKSILKSDAKNKDDLATDCISFAFLCYFLQGKQEDGIVYIKRFKDQIDPQNYTNNLMMQLIRDITKAVVNKKEKYIDQILDNFSIYKYSTAEMILIKEALIIGLASLMMEFKVELPRKEYEKDEMIEIEGMVSFTRLNEFKSYEILPRTFEKVAILNCEFKIGDNISLKDKPDFPIELNLANKNETPLNFKFRSNFQGMGSIGPLILTIEVDGKYLFNIQTEKHEIQIVSPDAVIGINLLPLKTPVINQSFPLQVIVSNKSEGTAMEISIEFEFPEDMKMMRGTFDKNIYSLNPNENMKWEIMVKALDVGEIPIIAKVSFKDGDGNQKGPFSASLPLNINL